MKFLFVFLSMISLTINGMSLSPHLRAILAKSEPGLEEIQRDFEEIQRELAEIKREKKVLRKKLKKKEIDNAKYMKRRNRIKILNNQAQKIIFT